jgi:hypothetical protein
VYEWMAALVAQIGGSWGSWNESQPGGDVHDGRVCLLLQQRQKRSGKTDGAKQISADGGFRVREIILLGLEFFDTHDTRIVDQHIQRRVARCHLNGERTDAGGVFDVERMGSHTGVLGGGLVERLLAAASDDDPVSEGVEGFCKATANAGAAACDQDCVASGLHCGRLFRLVFAGCNRQIIEARIS